MPATITLAGNDDGDDGAPLVPSRKLVGENPIDERPLI